MKTLYRKIIRNSILTFIFIFTFFSPFLDIYSSEIFSVQAGTLPESNSQKLSIGLSLSLKQGINREFRKPLFALMASDLSSNKETNPEGATDTTGKGYVPIGRKRITGDIFGRKGGYLHPFLSITEAYSDNIFNTKEDKRSDLVTILTPGIWISVPRVKQKLLKIETTNISPGGLTLSRFKPEFFRRYQAYLFYKADLEQFSKYKSENTDSHRVEALFRYNFRGGLYIDLVDEFVRSYDARGTGISADLDKFNTNLLNLILTYDVSKKFNFRIDCSNFVVDYDAARNNFRDRVDSSFSGYLFYKFKPKTAAFVEYELINIDYDEGIIFDSKEHHLFGGLKWDITAKSKGRIKAGYGIKDFADPATGDNKGFVLEAQIDHKFTPKTSLKLIASRRTNETNISTTNYILSNNIEIEYLQRVTAKITGSVNLSYTNDKYNGALTYGGETKEREDNLFRAAVAFQYEFKEWLKTDAGYIYTRRDSSFSDFGYISNTIFFRLTGSL